MWVLFSVTFVRHDSRYLQLFFIATLIYWDPHSVLLSLIATLDSCSVQLSFFAPLFGATLLITLLNVTCSLLLSWTVTLCSASLIHCNSCSLRLLFNATLVNCDFRSLWLLFIATLFIATLAQRDSHSSDSISLWLFLIVTLVQQDLISSILVQCKLMYCNYLQCNSRYCTTRSLWL